LILPISLPEIPLARLQVASDPQVIAVFFEPGDEKRKIRCRLASEQLLDETM
jgi:hypothetical protein